MWTLGADITREEYLHLLDTAKQLGREQAYLLVKVMATTGVSILGLPELTVEAVQAGKLRVEHDIVPLAAGLRDELMEYAVWKNVKSGPVFVTRSRKPCNQSRISYVLHSLSKSAGVDKEKCRPSALRKLYRATKADAEARAPDMVEQLMDRQADAEARIADMVEQRMERQAEAKERVPGMVEQLMNQQADTEARAVDMAVRIKFQQAVAEPRFSDMVEQLMDRQANAETQAVDMAVQVVDRQASKENRSFSSKRREKLFPTQKTTRTEVATEKSNIPWPPTDEPGILMTNEDIEGYRAALLAKGRTTAAQVYSSILRQLYEDLPVDKHIRKGTLDRWVELLREKGYAANTINGYAIMANGFLDYIGHREFQLSELPKQEDNPQPELTRNEYLQLLQAAKRLDREREYLLVKLFASCDLPVQELRKVTVEAAKAGCLTVESSGTRSVLHLPGCLCRELLAYADRQYIGAGPIFLSYRVRAMSRGTIVQSIARLSDEAGVPSEKCNPQCLRRLYKTTREEVEASFAVLVEQAMDMQAEQESIIAGWEV